MAANRPTLWRLKDAVGRQDLAYEWVAIKTSPDATWWQLGKIISFFTPSALSRGHRSVADIGQTYITQDLSWTGLTPPPTELVATGGQVVPGRCIDWYLSTCDEYDVDIHVIDGTTPPGCVAPSTPANRDDVAADVARAHGLPGGCTLTICGTAALYLALTVCESLGRRPLDNKGTYFGSENVCLCLGGDPSGSVLVWDFGAFNLHCNGEQEISARVDTVLLDITLLGPTAAPRIQALAKTLGARGVDLVVWSSLSKLTQGGRNAGAGGFAACLSPQKAFRDAFEEGAQLHDKHIGANMDADLEHLTVDRGSTQDIPYRWLSNLYLWTQLRELNTPHVQPTIFDAPLFVSVTFEIPDAVTIDRIHHDIDRRVAPEIVMRNSFGFNGPVFNSYTSAHDGVIYGTIRFSVPALSKDRVERLARLINGAVREALSLHITKTGHAIEQKIGTRDGHGAFSG